MQHTKKQLLNKLAELYGESHESKIGKNSNGFWYYLYKPKIAITLGRTINQAYRYVEIMIKQEAINAKNGT